MIHWRSLNSDLSTSYCRLYLITYSYFEKRCRKKMCTWQPQKGNYGIWSIHCFWHWSCRSFFCCFPLAVANICPWPLVPFFKISLKNSEYKTTHNTFRDCREQFFRQPQNSCIHHFHIDHNAPCLPPKILHNDCFQSVLGITVVPGEIQDNGYANFGG